MGLSREVDPLGLLALIPDSQLMAACACAVPMTQGACGRAYLSRWKAAISALCLS